MKTRIHAHTKREWAVGLSVFFVIVGFVTRALSVPYPCVPSCGAWGSCVQGHVNNPGVLNKTNETICIDTGVSEPVVSGTTFVKGYRKRLCKKSNCTTYYQYDYVTYTATNWWEPPIPATFDSAGIFVFTNKVRGITTHPYCPSPTATTDVGTYTVTVIENPTVTIHPTNQSVCAGSTAVFTASNSPAGWYEYVWKFGTNVLAGQTNSSLVLSNAISVDAGTYTVTVTGECGSATNSATLTVNTNLTVSGPFSLSVCPDSTANFAVTAFGTGPFTYQWKFGTNVLAGETNSSLTVLGAGPTNVGTYSVVVSGSCGSVTRSATLKTLTIVTQPASQTITNGQNATFSVSATGYDAIAYQWRKNGMNIPGANGSSYTIFQPDVEDSGSVYSVMVSSPDCSLVSSNAVLTVIELPPAATMPTVVSEPASQVAVQGSNASFSVSATGTLPLNYQWRLDGNDIPGAITDAYSLIDAQLTNAGGYSVVIGNVAGSVTSSVATLTVIGVDRVILDGSDPEVQGAASSVVGTSYALAAVPSPANASFPGGLPVWTIVSQPPESALPTNLPAGFSVSITPTNIGQYLIRATCGTSAADFTITGVGLEDQDYDGVSDQQELLDGTDPNDPDSVLSYHLGSWRFDSTNWVGVNGQVPVTFTNLMSIRGVSGNSVLINTNVAAWLAYGEIETNSPVANLNCRKGTVSFWFKPQWSSGESIATAPTNDARLIEFGTKGSADGCWGLYLGTGGTNIYFCTQTNLTSTLKTNLQWSIDWTSNNWRHVALTYCPTNTLLYIDGQRVIANGGGVTNWPGASVRAEGFRVGSARGGTNQARGRFDNLRTSNYERSEDDILTEVATTCFEGMDVMLVLDRSGSMSGTKIANAKIAASNFVARLGFDEDKAGVAAFNDSPIMPLPHQLTNNLGDIVGAIWSLNASGYTRIDRGITNGTHELLSVRHAEGALPVLVVLSDGSNNVSGMTFNQLQAFNSNTLYAASIAKSNAVRVVSIALGSDADTNLMRQIASSTNLYYYADQSDELDSVFSSLSGLLCRNATNPPTVEIFYPTNGQVLSRSLTHPIRALASDPQNALVGVRFYLDSMFMGQVNFGEATNGGTIYTLNWTPPSIGTYVFKAVATNAFGLTGTSAPVTVSVIGMPPIVTIINPQNGDQEDAIASIQLMSIAQDADGIVTNVDYYMNGGYIGSKTLSPYVLLTNDFHAGEYVFRAVATDDDGLTGSSQYVTNIVNPRYPTVVVSQPHSNDVFAIGEPIQITANATDADGWITNLQILTNGVLFSSIAADSHTIVWSNAPLGSNQIMAIAFDNDGYSAVSDPVPITVQGCPVALVTNVVLGTNQVVGGESQNGTVFLTGAATKGGQAVNLWTDDPSVVLPESVLVPEGQASVAFSLDTPLVGEGVVVTIFASYHGQTPKTADFTINPRSDGGINMVQYCGPMDVAFVVDVTGSMWGSIYNVIIGLTNLLGRIETASGNDYRLALVSFRDNVIVDLNFDVTNRVSFASALNDLYAGGGGGYAEASDEALNTVIHTLNAAGRYQTGDFTNAFRGDARKVIILITDAPPGGFNDPDYEPYNAAHGIYQATEAARAGIQISAVYVGGLGYYYDDIADDPFVESLMREYADLSGGVYVPVYSDGEGTATAIDAIIAQCGTSEGGVVVVRDDQAHLCPSFSIDGPALGKAADLPALFDTKGVWGTVNGAYLQRATRVSISPGSRFDLELGAASIIEGASSFGLLLTNAHELGSVTFDFGWHLPTTFFAGIESQMNEVISLQLTDRVSSVCGEAYTVTDLPQAGWPETRKNILTLSMTMDRLIPAGRCRSFIVTGTNGPVNGAWDIVFRDRVIAASGNPNGWDVEEDYTVFKGYTVTVPTNAVVSAGYEVRVYNPEWTSGRSARFEVLPVQSIFSAPVLLPLTLSTNFMASSGCVELTVALDFPAPFGDAYVMLEGPGNVPPYVVIPTGMSSVTTNIQVDASAVGTLEIMASYNGYRKACLRTDPDPCSPPATPGNLVGSVVDSTIVLTWDAVTNAEGYNVSRSLDGSVYTPIFQQLTTNRFVDTEVFAPSTNYYRVTAVRGLCESSAPAETNVQMQIAGRAPAPWIIPFGGTFNDSVDVLLTNALLGATVYYTTNGLSPDTGSENFANGGVITLTNNATLKAFATHTDYSQPSRTVSANFTVIKPASISCGANLEDALTRSSAPSTVHGSGYYGQRYKFIGAKGYRTTISVTSSEFDTVIYLRDPAGQIIAANDDIGTDDTDSQISFVIQTNGAHTIEVTSFSAGEVGGFVLDLDCSPIASINVYTNGVELENYDVVDFGTSVLGVPATNYIVVSNLGLATLILDDVTVLPTNYFTVLPASTSVPPGSFTNLQVELLTDVAAEINGVLVITNNVTNSIYGSPSQNPFILYLTGNVLPPEAPPQVSLVFPTNNTLIPDAPVNIQLYATASDADGITNVAFNQLNPNTLLGSTNNWPYTTWWSNVTSGQYALVAVAWDAKGNFTTSAPVNITIGLPTLVIVPTNACVGLSNTPHTVTATLRDSAGTPLVNSNVTFTVVGVSMTNVVRTTDGGGVATFTYTNNIAGADRIFATSVVDGQIVQSATAIKSWAGKIQCDDLFPGSLTDADGYSIGCGCAAPARYSDFYDFTASADDIVTFTMKSTNFSTFMFLMTTNCTTVAVTNEALNANDTQIRLTIPSNGTYIVEATSLDIFKTGDYTLQMQCGPPTNAPEIALLVSGTNVSSGSLLDFGTTTNGTPVFRPLIITNKGTDTLSITALALTSGYMLLPWQGTNIDPGGSAAYTLKFDGTNAQYNGLLVLTNNDSDENPFVLNLTAIANPPGQPPTVNITDPTNGMQFSAPAGITITADVTASGASITNVEFVFRTAQGVYLIGSDKTPPYTTIWSQAVPGTYTLLARASDSLGRATISSPVTVEIYPSAQNNSPVAVNDTPSVLANSMNNVLDLLANDTDADHDPLIITTITAPAYGTAEIIDNGAAVRYTPPWNIYGSDGFSYQISDGKGGTASGSVVVSIQGFDPLSVVIVDPPNNYHTNAGSVVPIKAQVTPSDYVVKVEYYLGITKIGEVTNGVNDIYTLDWTAYTYDCTCHKFTAVATDQFGQVETSPGITIYVDPPTGPGSEPPVAAFDNLQGTVTQYGDFVETNLATIDEGLFDLMGRAYDPDSADTAWILRLYDENGIFVKELTPAPMEIDGFHSGEVGSESTSGLLTTCDFTLVPNGVYEIELTVRGGYQTRKTSARFRLDSNLKIGQFTFTEQDLMVPVSGIPLIVTRTYDSLNSEKGDFGYSWTYIVSDLDVELYDIRDDTARDITTDRRFSLRVGGPRDVTITLPTGQRVTFLHNWGPGDCSFGLCVGPEFIGPPGMNVTLEAIGNHRYAPFVGRWVNDANSAFEWYEYPGYVLTMQDGTRYIIERKKIGEFQVFSGTAGDFSATPYGPPYLSRIEQPDGNVIEFRRDSFNRASRIQHRDPAGNPTRAIIFQRDGEGRIISVSDPLGQNASGQPVGPVALKYEYDSAGNLSKVFKLVDRSGSGTYTTNRYLYEESRFPHYLTKIIDARGMVLARNLYDENGKLIGVVDAYGHTNRYEYDMEGQREIHFDRSGAPTIYHYDKKGNVLSVTDPLGHTNGFTYDDNGYRLTSSDGLGNTTYYTNDADGNMLSVVLPHPAGANPAAYTTHFTYDSFGNQTSVRLPTGAVITNELDALGNLLAVRDESGNVISSTTYNASGLPATESDHFGSLGYAYDGAGNLIRMTNSLGQVVESSYDLNGNLTNLMDGGVAAGISYDALNRETATDYGHGITAQYGYEDSGEGDWSSISGPTLGSMERYRDAQGRLSGWTTANGSTPGFAYDVNGRLEYQTNSIGGVMRTVYDAAGRVIAITNLATSAGTTFGYDAANRRTAVTNALGGVTLYAYNPDGSLAIMTNAMNYVWYFDYETGGACCGGGSTTTIVSDQLGRQMSEVRSAHGLPVSTVWRGGGQVRSNYIEYLPGLTTPEQEAQEYPVAITDEGGRTRRYDYTELGQLYRATDLSGTTWWTNEFDADTGLLTNMLSPTGETLSYTYDELDNVETIRFGDGNYLTNFHDAANRLSTNVLPSGVEVHYEYDFAGRLTNLVSTVGEQAVFEYNGNDAVTRMTDNTGGTTNLYDVAGRLWGIDFPSGARVRYELDKLDRITAITNKATAGGTAYVTRYQYDAIGNVTNVIDPFDGSTRFEYDRVGRKTRRVLPNGIVTTWEYNWCDQVTNIVHKTSGETVLASFAYVRDTGGEPTKITREDGSSVELQYDAALRLTNEVYKTSEGAVVEEISYGYDAAGSRIRLVKGGNTLTNSVSAGYRITQVKSGAAVAESYTYDNGGRVTGVTRDDATRSFGYNSADQVTAVTNGASWVTYTHDANGRRTISTNSAGTVRRLLVAPTPGTDLESPHLIADASGMVKQGYVYLGGEPLMRFETGGNVVYYLEDAMGSVAALANDSGNKVASFSYDGFGNFRTLSGSTNAPTGTGGDFRFHRAWLEEESGLYHARAREFDPRTGRFTSRDPRNGVFQRAETLNPYVYAVNNSYVFTDPSGEFTLVEFNVSSFMSATFQSLKTYAINKAKEYLKGAILKAVSQLLVNQLGELYPPLGSIWKALRENKVAQAGRNFEDVFKKMICGAIGADGPIVSMLWFYPGLNAEGEAKTPGLNCPNLSLPGFALNRFYPDFVLSEVNPTKTPNEGRSIFIGDFKLSGNSLYKQYVKPGKHRAQFDAITRYAGTRTYTRTAVFLSVFSGQRSKLRQVQALLGGDGLKKGVVVIVIAAKTNKNF